MRHRGRVMIEWATRSFLKLIVRLFDRRPSLRWVDLPDVEMAESWEYWPDGATEPIYFVRPGDTIRVPLTATAVQMANDAKADLYWPKGLGTVREPTATEAFFRRSFGTPEHADAWEAYAAWYARTHNPIEPSALGVPARPLTSHELAAIGVLDRPLDFGDPGPEYADEDRERDVRQWMRERFERPDDADPYFESPWGEDPR